MILVPLIFLSPMSMIAYFLNHGHLPAFWGLNGLEQAIVVNGGMLWNASVWTLLLAVLIKSFVQAKTLYVTKSINSNSSKNKKEKIKRLEYLFVLGGWTAFTSLLLLCLCLEGVMRFGVWFVKNTTQLGIKIWNNFINLKKNMEEKNQKFLCENPEKAAFFLNGNLPKSGKKAISKRL